MFLFELLVVSFATFLDEDNWYSFSEDDEESDGDSNDKQLDYEEKRALAKKEAEELKRQLNELHDNADQKISQQNEVIKNLEEENSSLKEKVTKTKSILTGSVVPDDKEEDEESEEDISYEERASPDIWWTQTTLKIKEENQWAQY